MYLFFALWNSDVRSKAFQAVDQFLQIVKQTYEKVHVRKLDVFCFSYLHVGILEAILADVLDSI